MMFATIVFFASLALIALLFVVRRAEERRGGKFAPRLRETADEAALDIKDLLVRGRTHMEKLPPEVAHVAMRGVHAGALGAAHMARQLEAQSHRFADMVSTRRSFKRGETKSEFLKEVSDFRNAGEETTGEEERSEE
jgi:hypothetical protein